MQRHKYKTHWAAEKDDKSASMEVNGEGVEAQQWNTALAHLYTRLDQGLDHIQGAVLLEEFHKQLDYLLDMNLVGKKQTEIGEQLPG